MSDKDTPADGQFTLPPIKAEQRKECLLVAEDNLINQKVALGMLRNLGFGADIVRNGQEAVAAVLAHHYDLVLMDCHMPLMNGYDATRAIRKTFSQAELPIIALTANAMPGDEEKCLATGMNAYLVKPLDINVLQEKLALYLPLP